MGYDQTIVKEEIQKCREELAERRGTERGIWDLANKLTGYKKRIKKHYLENTPGFRSKVCLDVVDDVFEDISRLLGESQEECVSGQNALKYKMKTLKKRIGGEF